MAWYWRRSKKLGPFRITASRRGMSVSAGNAVHRKTVNTRRQSTSTWRIPGTGIFWRKTRRR
jgi:hypothetical protein